MSTTAPKSGKAAPAATRSVKPRAASGRAESAYDADKIRQDFPILSRRVYGKPLVYLDSAASAQKPRAVIDAIRQLYENDYSNVHRGVHFLSQRASEAYEGARETVRQWINARETGEIVFVRGTTEAINLVASSFGRKWVGRGDEIVISAMEHHSNIVPWQMLCEATGAVLRIAPITDSGELLFEEFERLVTEKTRLVSIVHLSNALGTINPAREIVRVAHERGARVLFDGAQAAAHMRIDVQELDCDFYAFSSHKLYGPTGAGVLYGKASLLDAMPPYQGGGDMIRTVTFEKTTYNDIPFKFEAGTQSIADVVGLGAAIDYLGRIDLSAAAAHERRLSERAAERLAAIPGLKLVGTAREKASIVSFVIEGIHPHDIGTILDRDGIAIRAGHHCTQPLMQRLGLAATARASFGIYNTEKDVDALVAGVQKAIEVFR